MIDFESCHLRSRSGLVRGESMTRARLDWASVEWPFSHSYVIASPVLLHLVPFEIWLRFSRTFSAQLSSSISSIAMVPSQQFYAVDGIERAMTGQTIKLSP
jgi:hypothetical protein